MLAQVGMTNKLEKDEEYEDGKQLEAGMQALTRRHVGLQSSGSGKVIPVDALRARAKMVGSSQKVDKDGDNKDVDQEMSLHDTPASVFEQTSCEGVGRPMCGRAILCCACDP